MKVSNNDFFNAVVRELHCPDLDLSGVIRYEAYKARSSGSTQSLYYNAIRLRDSSARPVCYISNAVFASQEAALQSLRNGYHCLENSIDIVSQAGSVRSIIDWDYAGFTAGVVHQGSIQLSEAYESLQHNPSIALHLGQKGRNLFHPFYHIVSARLLVVNSLGAYTKYRLSLKDKKGIRHEAEVRIGETRYINTDYGILEINELPIQDEELELCVMFDSADGGLGMYPCASIDLSKWRPTPGNGIIWDQKSINPPFNTIIQGDYPSSEDRYKPNNCIASWRELQPTKTSVTIDKLEDITHNLELVTCAATVAASRHEKFILTFMPSTLTPNEENGCVEMDGSYIYYDFPDWVLELIQENKNGAFTNALYIKEVVPIYQVNHTEEGMAKIFVINWHNSAIRALYLSCCSAVVLAMSNTTITVGGNEAKPLLNYIDAVKVAFWDSWGEGVQYCTITGHNGNLSPLPPGIVQGPTGVELEEISTSIIQLFNNYGIVCLLPLMSYFNTTFPKAYRDYILSASVGSAVVGYFFDGVGSNIAYWHEENANGFKYDPEVMNQLFLAHQTKPIYLECSTHLSKTEIPNYQNLISFIRYFRCVYFNPQNIFFNARSCKFNEIAMLRDISRYVGVKIGLLGFNYERVKDCPNQVRIMLRFLNCGTAKIYHNNWKLNYYLLDVNGVHKDKRESSFQLKDIMAAFEEDSPNWHDAADFNAAQGRYDDNSELVIFSNVTSIVSGDKLCIAIEDDAGVYENYYLSNSEEYLQRDSQGRYCLFSFAG